MATITLDLFSGRKNPSFELPASEMQALLPAITRDAISTEEGPSILGFRGVIVTLDEATAAQYGLPTYFRLGDGRAANPSSSAALAERILHHIPETLGIPRGALVPWVKAPVALDIITESVEPKATGQSDVGLDATSSIQDGKCQVEVGRYTPAFWNSPQYVRENNNCYAYGCNMRTNTFPQPGRYAGKTLEYTLASVKACAQADGLVLQGNCMPSARRPRWLVALVTTEDNIWDWDYHWYRKQQDGFWGHKPGRTLVTNRDQSGQIIADPQTCNRGVYTVWGGYLYVPQTANIR